MKLLVPLAMICLAVGLEAASDDPNGGLRTALQTEVEDFSRDWNRWTEGFEAVSGPFAPAAGPQVENYRRKLVKTADWQSGPVWPQIGLVPWVRAKTTEYLGVNVFLPESKPKGVVAVIHGYMSHAVNFAYTFRWFVARGWAVVTLDLPGHGFSTGKRADVSSFSDYGDAVAAWSHWIEDQGWSGPRVLVAHSLGTAATFEALRRPGATPFDQLVFCAPLLRPDWYAGLSLAESLVSTWVNLMPSTFGWDGYLDGYKMPIHWFQALKDWLPTLEDQSPLRLPLTIYQGTRDTVVDEGWNLAEYRRLVPRAKQIILPGKNHLFLTNKEDREAFHTRLTSELGL